MNREIKFRGLSINGEWYFGNLSIIHNKVGPAEPGSYISNSYGMPFAYQIRPETAGQYTGTTDRNGKETYEGDIVKILSAKSGHAKRAINTGIITWDTTGMPGFTVVLVIGGEKWAYGFLDHRTLEVIGNIYENPDLIK